MARPLRIEFPGALYHVTSRGNDRAAIYADDADRRLFLAVLADVIGRYNWRCHAYCLMTNHYHLLLDTPDANLSLGMRQLNGAFTQRSNRRHARGGHVFQGRFHSILVERETHLLELARYIVLNPVRARMAQAAEAYTWSSLRATVGLEERPPWLTIESVLASFGSRARYLTFVREGIGRDAPWKELKGTLLGSEGFVEAQRERLDEHVSQNEVPRRERLAHRPRLEEVLSPEVVSDRSRRNERMRWLIRMWGYPLADVGRHVGLHYATVSRIVRSHEDEPSSMLKYKT
jgi:REP-associated tyrosine transposase